MSDSLQPREPQHARLPCPSPTPRVHPNLCPSSRWCHPTIILLKVKPLSCVRLFVTLWTVAYQASLSMGFSRQEYQSGLPFPSPGDLPEPGIEPTSPALWADALPSEPLRLILILLQIGDHSNSTMLIITKTWQHMFQSCWLLHGLSGMWEKKWQYASERADSRNPESGCPRWSEHCIHFTDTNSQKRLGHFLHLEYLPFLSVIFFPLWEFKNPTHYVQVLNHWEWNA